MSSRIEHFTQTESVKEVETLYFDDVNGAIRERCNEFEITWKHTLDHDDYLIILQSIKKLNVMQYYSRWIINGSTEPDDDNMEYAYKIRKTVSCDLTTYDGKTVYYKRKLISKNGYKLSVKCSKEEEITQTKKVSSTIYDVVKRVYALYYSSSDYIENNVNVFSVGSDKPSDNTDVRISLCEMTEDDDIEYSLQIEFENIDVSPKYVDRFIERTLNDIYKMLNDNVKN